MFADLYLNNYENFDSINFKLIDTIAVQYFHLNFLHIHVHIHHQNSASGWESNFLSFLLS